MKATDLLRKQHREVENLFSKILKSDDPGARKAIAFEINSMLEVHMMIEEETFYPAYRNAARNLKGEDLVLEAFEEHHVVDLVLAELPKINTSAETFTAKMKVLAELIDHHVEEEEDEMFPDAEARLGAETLERLGALMEVRVDQLSR